MGNEFDGLDDVQLLRLWARVMAELRERDIVRSSNSPLGDYCELLVAAHFGVKPVGGSNPGYDLITNDGVRVQVKSRRLTSRSPRVGHFSVMHKLDEHGFDDLIAVVLNEDFSVKEAWLVPWDAAKRLGRFNNANNGHVLPYTQAFLNAPDIVACDITDPGGASG